MAHEYTLFNFQQISDAQQISAENKQNYFVFHPDISKSNVFGVALDKGLDIIALRKLALGSEYISGKSELEELAPVMFTFSEVLANERSKLSVEELKEQTEGIQNLSDEQLLAIWDQFMIHCLIQINPYVRDSIQYILKANHFLKCFRALDLSDKDISKYASATVVLPKQIFGQKRKLKTSAEINRGNRGIINKAALRRQMAIMEAELEGRLLTDITSQIRTLQDQEIKHQREATEEEQIRDEERVAIDEKKESLTESTKERVVKSVAIPEKRRGLLKEETLKKGLNSDHFHKLASLNLTQKSDYSEIRKGLQTKRAALFKKSTTSIIAPEKLAYMGKVPVAIKANIGGKDFAYLMKIVKAGKGKHALFVVINPGGLKEDLNDASVKFANPLNTIVSDFHYYYSNGLLCLDFTPNQFFEFEADKLPECYLTGKIEFISGKKLSWRKKI